jgi:hypothetical protein
MRKKGLPDKGGPLFIKLCGELLERPHAALHGLVKEHARGALQKVALELEIDAESRWACRTQTRKLSGEQTNLSAIAVSAAASL